MKTLIVGCGYLGLRVARRLLDRGEEVLGTTRREARFAALRAAGIEPVCCDVAAPPDRLPAVDRVVHCVGNDRAAGVPMRVVYVDGLLNVVDRLIERPMRFVYASTTGVYAQSGGEWVDEDAQAEPTSESGRVCLDAERALLDASSRRGLSAVILRFSGLYGPGRIVRREALARGEAIVGEPSRWLNLVQIDDAASAVVAALDAADPRPLYTVSDDRPVPRVEYYRLVADLIGAPPPRFRPPAPGESTRREDSDKRVSNRRIKAELSWNPTYPDIDAGVPASLAAEASGPPIA